MTSRRGIQGSYDGVWGKRQIDGRCGSGWCGVERRQRRGWGSGRRGRIRRRRTRADGEGLGGLKKVT